MEIIPAIDLKGGKCVRLYQGDYEQETVFDEDPTAAALRWYSQGAQWLHVVDLDGAAMGEPRNVEAVGEIIKQSGLLVELGGGIRQESVAGRLLQGGVSRIILGTVAIENPESFPQIGEESSGAIIDLQNKTIELEAELQKYKSSFRNQNIKSRKELKKVERIVL